ncbi:acyltransferase [uncultured Mucilaginibacter sp.]|uniref:acyltransferase family protein n=1 Tax=uncultured Mucilaginibacter sp. TaxID=797541 RepID=UPI002605C02C|nr:acyltransferase [uncultured Mucilaginibacter sp.]
MKYRFEILDIFRGLFAFIVVLYHLKTVFPNSISLNNEFISNGYMFVDFFFVLSGFVIAYNYESKISNYIEFKQFMVKRLFRVYPLHLVMLMIALMYVVFRIIIGFHFKPDAIKLYTVETFFTNLFLLNSIKFPNTNDLSWNYPSWSISAEVISYMVFAAFTLTIKKLNLSYLRTIVWLLVLGISIYWIHSLSNNYFIFLTYNNGFIRGLIGFFSGVICQQVFQKLTGKINGNFLITFTILEVTAILLIIYFVTSGNLFKSFGLIYDFVFLLSILIFSFEKGLLSEKIKKIRLLKEIGKFSYSIYMTHALIIIFASIVLKKIINKNYILDTIIECCLLLVIYYTSKWTYKNIELRFYNISHKPKIKN